MEWVLVNHAPTLAPVPDIAEIYATLGKTSRILGRPQEAIANYQKALAHRPHCANTHNDLAGVLCALGRTTEAIDHYQRALSAQPECAEAHYNLANILHGMGRHEDAIAHYGEALRAKLCFPEAHNNMANVLQVLRRYDEAVAGYKAALALKPQYADARHNLGKAYFALGRNQEAIVEYENALRIDPSRAAVHNDIAAVHLVLGRLQDAYVSLETAAARAPRNAAYHLNLASVKSFAADDHRLAALEQLAEVSLSLGDGHQIALHFALGKAHADLGNAEKSFHHFLRGNGLKRRQIAYNEEATLAGLDRIRSAFTRELMRRKSGCGDPSVAPVFIVGIPRSGTTLLEQILAGHSAVFGAGEIDDFAKAAREFLKTTHAAPQFSDAISRLPSEHLRLLGQRYVAGIVEKAPHSKCIVNKMPSNFAYVGLIHLALPNARIIHARRDPVDTCWSCFALLFADDQPHCYDLAELGHYYRAYASLMRHWQAVLPEGVMIEVHYEDVVRDLEGQARRLVAHCGLEWEDRCLAFHQTQRPVHTASVTQVRRPIYRESVGRSQPYKKFLRPLFEALEMSN